MAFIALLVLGISSFGCDRTDPLEAVIQQQGRGDFAGSIEPLREILKERPEDPQVHYLYGRALTATGQVSLAEWSLRKAKQHPEWLQRAGKQLAVGALGSGNYDTVIEITTELLEDEPDNLKVMVMRAQAYVRSRRFFEEALAEAERILELDPGNTDAMEPKIVSLLKLDRIDEAEETIALLGKWIEEEGDASDEIRGWHCATEAIFAMDKEETKLADERWTACLAEHPAHPNVVSSALQFYDGQKDFPRSLEIMAAAFEALPSSLDFRRKYAGRLAHAGRRDEGEALMIESTKAGAAVFVPHAYVDLAKFYQDLGDREKAAAATSAAVEASRALGPVPAQLLLEQADALVLSRDLDGALAVADEMTVQPHRELIRARVAQVRGDHAQALVHFEEAFRLWPNNTYARYYAAQSAAALGDFDRAIESYRYAIRIDVGATNARTRLAEIHIAEGLTNEGIHLLHFLESSYPLELEGQLLALRMSARLQQPKVVNEELARLQKMGPRYLGRGLVSAAEGVEDRSGVAAAYTYLVDLVGNGMVSQTPDNPWVLRKLVALAGAAGRAGDVEQAVRASLSAHPSAAPIHEVLGDWLSYTGAPEAEVEAAYRRALELDSQSKGALMGLGRGKRESDPQAALDFFDRAAEADPDDPAPKLEAARLAITLGPPDEVDRRFGELLEEHPLEAGAAAEWASNQLERGTAGPQTVALAERAVRFRGGPPALDLLARAYRALGDEPNALEAEERGRLLRERRQASANPAS